MLILYVLLLLLFYIVYTYVSVISVIYIYIYALYNIHNIILYHHLAGFFIILIAFIANLFILYSNPNSR